MCIHKTLNLCVSVPLCENVCSSQRRFLATITKNKDWHPFPTLCYNGCFTAGGATMKENTNADKKHAKSLDEFLKQIREEAYCKTELGTRFERFVKAYLLSDFFGVKFSDVWLWSECPYSHGHDIGVDLVARDTFGDFHAVQCKCYAPGTSVSMEDVAQFLAASGKTFYVDCKPKQFASRILVSTSDSFNSNAEAAIQNQNPPVTRIGLADLKKTITDAGFFDFDKNKAVVKKLEERPHQTAAVADVLNGFDEADRGQLVMACGTGKTFTALRIAEDMKCKSVLFMVPSISLLAQALRVWVAQAKEEIATLAVCSDSKVDKDEGDIAVCDLGFPATTSVDTLIRHGRALKHKPPKGMVVTFSTYQSIDAISEAQKAGAFGTFDLIICDEAHRTTGATFDGADPTDFVKVHQDKFVRGRKRLYMTATPRVYSDAAQKRADEEAIVLCSMDDEDTYGKEFHHLSFSAAVAQDLLSDYKVQILAVAQRDIERYGFKDYDGDGTIDNIEDIGKWVGCWKAFNKKVVADDLAHLGTDLSPMRSVVAFSSSIRESKTFASGFNKLVETFAGTEGLRPATVKHVDGTMNALVRGRELDWLRDANRPGNTECRILSNAKCLSEGVDVPGLDAIAFLSPKNSFVEIVQAIGRVMRKAEGKQFGYVIIPVVIPEGLKPEEVLADNKRFKVVWQILAAIRSHDDGFHTLDNKVDILRIEPLQERRPREKKEPEPMPPPPTIPPEMFIEYQKAIQAKLARVCGERKYWATWAGEVAEVVKTQIGRITKALSKAGNPYEHDFADFLASIRANLNDSITEEDAIEMLAQQLVSAPIFTSVFSDFDFVKENPVSQALAPMLELLNRDMDAKDRAVLDEFAKSIQNKASGHTTSEQKQHIIIELYNNFFNIAFKDTVEKLGIVYTPIECVDFIVRSVAVLLKEHFGRDISDKGVHLIDPFTGTGTFIVRTLQSGVIRPKDMARKYAEEIHANEIVLLAYYIAALNIEAVYHDLAEKAAGRAVAYRPFEGIVLTDTFNIYEKEPEFDETFPENSKRVRQQRKQPIMVVIGNPPYNVSKGVSYPDLEKAIADNYAKGVKAKNINSLYDSYIKAFRWATDRIGQEGVVAYISNAGWIDGAAMSGMRAAFQKEFSHIYVLNLRGDCRTSGDVRRREGDGIFGLGSRTPIAITLLVKKKVTQRHGGTEASGQNKLCGSVPLCEKTSGGVIHYHDIGDYLSREEKLELVAKFHDVSGVPWETIAPDRHNDWLNQRNAEFDSFIPLAPETKFDAKSQSFFVINSSGLKTGMDSVAVGYSFQGVIDSVAKVTGASDESKIVESVYRPFNRQWLYYDRETNQRQYRIPSIFPLEVSSTGFTGLTRFGCDGNPVNLVNPVKNTHPNLVIWVKGMGGSGKFSCFISDCIPDLESDGGIQCFPLYWYEERKTDGDQLELFGLEEKGKFIRHDGVSDFILAQFQSVLGSTITKEDIFFYVYGALHSPSYRRKFDADLKKQLPRLPLPKDMPTFKRVMKIGRDLAFLHLNYEEVEPWPLKEVVTGSKVSFRVEKLRFGKKGGEDDRSVIVVNPTLSLKGIPAEAYDYAVNGRPALEWIIDRYQARTDKDSGIVNDPNKWGEEHGNPRYIVDLIEKVVKVSVESAGLIAKIDGKAEAERRRSRVAGKRGGGMFAYPDAEVDVPIAAEEADGWRAEPAGQRDEGGFKA